MLNVVLRTFADFEKENGSSANILDISDRHFRMLVAQYPGIFSENSDLDLGFKVCVHQENKQKSPAVRVINIEAQPLATEENFSSTIQQAS